MSALPIAGSWVLVTGASSGLGRAAAICLADSYRAQPILVGRRMDSLLDLQSEIKARFGIASEVVAADQSTEDGRARIAAKVEELDAIEALLAAGVAMAAQSDLRWGRMGLMDADRCATLAVKALVSQRRVTVPGLGNRLTLSCQSAPSSPPRRTSRCAFLSPT